MILSILRVTILAVHSEQTNQAGKEETAELAKTLSISSVDVLKTVLLADDMGVGILHQVAELMHAAYALYKATESKPMAEAVLEGLQVVNILMRGQIDTSHLSVHHLTPAVGMLVSSSTESIRSSVKEVLSGLAALNTTGNGLVFTALTQSDLQPATGSTHSHDYFGLLKDLVRSGLGEMHEQDLVDSITRHLLDPNLSSQDDDVLLNRFDLLDDLLATRPLLTGETSQALCKQLFDRFLMSMPSMPICHRPKTRAAGAKLLQRLLLISPTSRRILKDMALSFAKQCPPPAWGRPPMENSFKMLTRHETGAVGLTNKGNTCYMVRQRPSYLTAFLCLFFSSQIEHSRPPQCLKKDRCLQNSVLQTLYALPETRAALMNGSLLPKNQKAGIRVRVKVKSKFLTGIKVSVTLTSKGGSKAGAQGFVNRIVAEGIECEKFMSTTVRNTSPPSDTIPAGTYSIIVANTDDVEDVLLDTTVTMNPESLRRGHFTIELVGDNEVRCRVVPKTLAFELQRLMFFLHYGKASFFDTGRLCASFADVRDFAASALEGGIHSQQDAGELIRVLLELLEDEMIGTEFVHTLKKSLRREETTVWTADKNSGHAGKTWVGNKDAATGIMLVPIKWSGSPSSVTLKDCLDHKFSEGDESRSVDAPTEIVAPIEPGVPVRIEAHPRIILTKLPPVMIFTLERFAYSNWGVMVSQRAACFQR